ncbi:ATP-binding protein [Mycolicibacterium neoaurum]|uniref:ATP-binding protein n=1 Tax=Mycolicibacterium neoaurum TaxID=1795 RepID=UPI001BCB27AC|nr:ATP-binding protein [Mycolicibacterium neoaurum]QVI27295.1 ATP-binding protein [Mycolicibacterium neoaurum]
MTSTAARSRTPKPRPTQRTRSLANLSLTRKEDWNNYVLAPSRTRPDPITRDDLAALSDTARAQYDRMRRDWHANLGPFKTPQFAWVTEQLWNITDSNLHDGDRVKGAIALDSEPGVGKTTVAQRFGRQFHLEQIEQEGPRTGDGHERWPVCWVSLTGNTTLRDLNRAMLSFYAHPGADRGTATQYLQRALDCVLSCETRLLVIDDLHFLRWPTAQSIQVSNHFKFIANTFPVTLLFIGVELQKCGLLSDRNHSNIVAQTARRTTVLGMDSFQVNDDHQRATWRNLLTTIEERVVLAGAGQGMLADSLADYLWARTNGYIGSLMTLINRGCALAIRSGEEVLTEELLDRIRLDAAAEETRKGNFAAIRTGAKKARMN